MDSPTELSDGPLRTVYASICASLSPELRYPLVADHDSAAAATCSACGWEACWPKLTGVPAELSGTPRCTVLGNASPFADTQCANPSCCFTSGPSTCFPSDYCYPRDAFGLDAFQVAAVKDDLAAQVTVEISLEPASPSILPKLPFQCTISLRWRSPFWRSSCMPSHSYGCTCARFLGRVGS